MSLNERAHRIADRLLDDAGAQRVVLHQVDGGGRVIDCGINTSGGIGAGLALARICLADLAEVTLTSGSIGEMPVPVVQVVSDHPVLACLASQYAGWQLAEGKFFAMGSGPMRSAYGHEEIIQRIAGHETASRVVGVLEGRKLPPPQIVAKVAESCGVDRDSITLLIAPTASLAGTLQVVARSVETALHKLAELGFDLSRIISAQGIAPLPPVAKDDLAAIGRTNDAILYGARVILHVDGDDDSLTEIGPKVPSSSSADHGEPFAEIFKRYNHDFYAVDPHLFSPAEVTFQNVKTGRSQRFGGVADDVLARSFFA